MFFDKPLRAALLISMIAHAAVFLPYARLERLPVKKPPTLRITYLRTAEAPEVKAGATSRKRVVSAKAGPAKIVAPKEAKPEARIEIPPELPREKEEAYISYYQTIRERIRDFVINNYPRFIACGEVCLYFILSSDGELKEVKVVQARSSRNRLLKEVARRSVQQASPFLTFPEDLGQSQLSFNVVISFELEN